MEPEIIEPPFESEDWITFSPKDMIENVSMVRIIGNYNIIEDREAIWFKFDYDDWVFSGICSFCMMLKKSKYGKVVVNENLCELTFSSKLFGFDIFKKILIGNISHKELQYKRKECNSTIHKGYFLKYKHYDGVVININRKLVVEGSQIGLLLLIKTNSLDRNNIKVLVNGKEKYSSCVNFHNDKFSAHFLQLNTLTLDEIANIYDNKKLIKNKSAKKNYTIDFLDNVIYDMLIIQKIDLAT